MSPRGNLFCFHFTRNYVQARTVVRILWEVNGASNVCVFAPSCRDFIAPSVFMDKEMKSFGRCFSWRGMHACCGLAECKLEVVSSVVSYTFHQNRPQGTDRPGVSHATTPFSAVASQQWHHRQKTCNREVAVGIEVGVCFVLVGVRLGLGWVGLGRLLQGIEPTPLCGAIPRPTSTSTGPSSLIAADL